jgi:hypothetical protein
MIQLHLFRNKSPVADFANGNLNLKFNSTTTTNNSNSNFMQINFTKLQRIPWKACMVLWMLCSLGNVKAQVNTYVFAASSGTYTPLGVGGTTIPGFGVGAWDDNLSAAITLPFTFTFNGTARTQIQVCSNGWATFNVANATNSYSPISSTTASINNVIAPNARDLQANAGTGNIVTGTVGVAPNRTFVIEWISARNYNAIGHNQNFQIRLNEQGGVAANQNVQVVYGTMTATTSATRQVGLKGATTADFNNRTTTTNWAGATNGLTNAATMSLSSTVLPAVGLTYTWTPPSLPTCTGTPAPGNTTSSIGTAGCSGAAITLALANQTVLNGQSNLNYQWQTSPDGITWSSATGVSTNKTYVTTFTATTSYRCLVTCTNGGAVGTSTSITVTLNPFYLCYCAAVAANSGDTEILNVTVGTLNNTSNCSVVAPGAGSILQRYANYGSVAPAGTVTTTITRLTDTPISINANSCGGFYTRRFNVFIDNNRDGDYTDAGELVYTTGGLGGSAFETLIGNINLPYTGVETDGLTGMRVTLSENNISTPCANPDWGEVEDYVITLATPPVCAGTPATSNALASSPLVCSGANFNLSLSTAYSGLGFSYQWSSSPDNSTWTPIGGATASTLTTTQTAGTYYRCVITCSFSGLTRTSSSVLVGMSNFYNCYCSSTALSSADEDILNVTFGTLNNSSTCISTGGAGSTQSLYSNYTGVAAPTIEKTSTYPLSVEVGTCGGNYSNRVAVYIDLNRDGDFDDLDENVYLSGVIVGPSTFTDNITIPISAGTGLTGLRVVSVETIGGITPCGTYTWGETEDYLINLTVPPPCTGTPAASNALASVASACAGQTFDLSLSTAYSGFTLTYQWESSPDNITWTPIVGATNSIASVTQSAATYYHCIIDCGNSGFNTTSASIQVNQNSLLACYCSSAATSTADEDILNVTFGTLNNSSTCTSTGGAGSVTQRYSNYTALAPASIDKGIPITFSARVAGCSGFPYTSQIGVFIDGNQDGDFTDAGELVLQQNGFQSAVTPGALVSGTINLPLTFLDGITGMRVITIESTSTAPMSPCGTYTWGETEDYAVNLTTPPPCTGTPGIASMPAPSSQLNGTTVTLDATGYEAGFGVTYQWQESPNNSTWTDVTLGSGGTTPSYTSGPLASNTITYFRLVTTCNFSGLSSNSASVAITSVGGATCADPYLVPSLPFSGNFSTLGAGNDIGAQTSACGNFYGGGDDAVFRFTVATAGLYEISAVNTSSTNWIGWFLKDNSNCATTSSSLACATSGTNNSAFNTVSLTPGTYYVVVDYWPTPNNSNFFIRIKSVPAAPANDNAGAAQVITHFGATCTGATAGTTAGASQSGEPTGCTGVNNDDDVWYAFVATADAVTIDVQPSTNGVLRSGSNIAWELAIGTPGAFTANICRNVNTGLGIGETGTVVGLLAGTTYYVRVYDANAGYGSALGNFSICLTTPPPPANNDCAGATNLTLNASCSVTNGNTVSATQSLAAASCSGWTGNADDDVWYKFDVVTPSTVTIDVTASTTNMDPVVQLFSGNCGSLTSVQCNDASLNGGVERISRSFTPGSYYLRVYNYGVGTGAGGVHTICIYSNPVSAQPVNDNTANAIVLPFVVDCSPQGPYESLHGTRTYLDATPAGTANDDVWFKFVTTSGVANIAVSGSSGYDAVFQVFQMSSAKVITATFPEMDLTGADQIEEQIIYGLTPGQTYYIRVYDFFGTNPSGNFSICAYQTPPPDNNLLVGAETIFQQNQTTCGGSTVGFTLSATTDNSALPCTGTADDDVWYQFVATSPTPTIVVTGLNGMDPVVDLRTSGNPGTNILCSNTTSANGTETINATGLTVGATYRVRVYSFGNLPVNQGVFNICIYGPASPPINDNCAGAIALPNTSPCTSVNGLTTGATQSQPGCGGAADDDVWYRFVAANTTATVTVTGNFGFDAVVQAFEGLCGSLNPIGSCVDNEASGGSENLLLTGLTPGQTYYVRTYDYFSGAIATPDFTICLTGTPPVNDNICSATLVTNISKTLLPSIATATNLGSTNSTFPGIPLGTFGALQNDVWYKAVVPANGVVAVNVSSLSIGDTRLRIYGSSDNTCTGTLSLLGEDDDSGPLTGSYKYLSGLTPGTTVFIAVDAYSTSNFGNFSLHVSDGWIWKGTGGTALNGTGNWINQAAGEATPAPGASNIINVSVGNGVSFQPQVTVNTTVAGIYLRGTAFTPASVSINSGITLTLDGSSAAGRTIDGAGTFGRISGPGTLALSGTGYTIAPSSIGSIRFGGSNPINVTLANTAAVNSNNKMVFENSSSLFSGLPTYGNLTGNITYRRQGNPSQYVFNFWSSPIAAGTLASLTAPGYIANTYEYNTALTTGLDYDGTQLGWAQLGPSAVMTPGRGYIATGAGLATFTGAPNQTDITYTPGVGGGGNTFNLVGNPYPCPISPSAFLATNSGRIQGSVLYVWDDDASGGVNYTAGDYITSNGAATVNGPNSGSPFTNIAACQGFFVGYTPSSGNISFAQSHKTTGTNSTFFDVATNPLLKLRLENAFTQASETVVAFADDATDAVDNQYDALRMPGNNAIGLYTTNADQNFVFQYWPTLTNERIVALGALNTVDGPASITMNQYDNFDASTVVFLEDMTTGTFHNLTANPTYTFDNGLISESTSRFRLHFRAPISVAASSDCAGNNAGKLIMNNPNSNPIVAQVVSSDNTVISTTAAFTGEAIVNNLAAGTYQLNFNYTDGTSTQKSASISDAGMPVAASFQASATNVSIVDAIVEFQGTAVGATELIWNFGDGTIVTGDINPVHAYMAPGIYTVTFTALNGGCGSEATAIVNVSDVTTGLANVSGKNGFSIYPNPANETANLLLNVDLKDSEVTISITDASGRLINKHNMNNLRSGAIVALDINDLANGVYEVTIDSKNFHNVGRLTIAK